MTISTGTKTPGVEAPDGVGVPVEQTGVTLGRSLRVALLHGREESSRRAVAQLALASGTEIVAHVRATDPRSFVEAAQALRDAKPDVVVIQGGAKDQDSLAELLEALDQKLTREEDTRSAVIRRLVEDALREVDQREDVRRYIEGYRKQPQTEEEFGWADYVTAEHLAEVEWKE